MTISIIIPLYNKAAHIERAIDSILAQTFADFELIVIDDGSTDGSGDIVRLYTDPRIRFISQENAGVSAARNRGIAEARTELVAFLDADDQWQEDFLETVLSLRERFPEAAVWGTGYAQILENGECVPVSQCEELKECKGGSLINFFRESLLAQPINCSTMLVQKAALQEIGGFLKGLVWLEDTNLLFRLALRHPIAYVTDIKSIYHMEADNRGSRWVFSGNNPFADNAREYFRQQGQSGRIEEMPEDVQQYVAFHQFGAALPNAVAGNHRVLRKIAADCWSVRGYRWKSLRWWCLSWLPHPCLLFILQLYRRWQGHPLKYFPIRSNYRQ